MTYSTILLLLVGLIYVTTNNDAIPTHFCSKNEDCAFESEIVKSVKCCIEHMCRDCSILKIKSPLETNRTNDQCVENWSNLSQNKHNL